MPTFRRIITTAIIVGRKKASTRPQGPGKVIRGEGEIKMDTLTFANVLQKSQWPSPWLERNGLLTVPDSHLDLRRALHTQHI